ncbi:MAG TPA: hypothetical protein VF041_07140, partial [Gemmatimonadaceae bacterium]
VGLAALHFSILASMHVRPGVPAWKAWFRPLNGDPELYTDVGNRYRHFREVYSWIGLAIGLALGATRLLK